MYLFCIAAADEDVMSLDATLPMKGWKTKVSRLLQKARKMFIENSDMIGSLEVTYLYVHIYIYTYICAYDK